MSKDAMEFEGTVINCNKGAKFDVELDVPQVEGKIITCTLAGKIQMNSIKILKGDKVTVEISPYDLSKGRITWRHK